MAIQGTNTNRGEFTKGVEYWHFFTGPFIMLSLIGTLIFLVLNLFVFNDKVYSIGLAVAAVIRFIMKNRDNFRGDVPELGMSLIVFRDGKVYYKTGPASFWKPFSADIKADNRETQELVDTKTSDTAPTQEGSRVECKGIVSWQVTDIFAFNQRGKAAVENEIRSKSDRFFAQFVLGEDGKQLKGDAIMEKRNEGQRRYEDWFDDEDWREMMTSEYGVNIVQAKLESAIDYDAKTKESLASKFKIIQEADGQAYRIEMTRKQAALMGFIDQEAAYKLAAATDQGSDVSIKDDRFTIRLEGVDPALQAGLAEALKTNPNALAHLAQSVVRDTPKKGGK